MFSRSRHIPKHYPETAGVIAAQCLFSAHARAWQGGHTASVSVRENRSMLSTMLINIFSKIYSPLASLSGPTVPPKTPGPWKALQLQWQSTKYSQAGILYVKIWVRFQKRDLANNGWGSRTLHKCQLLLCSILPGFCYSYIGTIAAACQGLSKSGLWSHSAKDRTQHVRKNISMPLWNKLIHYINLIKK